MKIKTRLLLLTTILLSGTALFGQNVRGYYISNVGTWLGNTTEENKILDYTQGNGFNYILFYDLASINWTSATDKNKLASFISRARSQYGVTQVGGVVEIYSFVTNYILPYNLSRTNANEKFDIINMEFEFWVTASISASYCSKFLSPNGYNCDTAGAWKFAWKEFKKIDSLCAAQGLMSEFYLGWPNKGQMQQIASIADRILLHSYRPTDSDVYAYSKNRLADIASLGSTKKVISLFSSEPSFMGPWLNTHPQTKPYQTYKSGLSAETASFKQFIDLQGYQWFTYQYMPKTVLATASITANGPLSFCSGGNVTLSANGGASYLWSPGGQTSQSITVATPGSYTVRVTNTSGTNATSSPVTVSLSTTGTPPTITASGPVSFCPGGSVVLTSTQASSYHWSNGQTTQSITVTASGSYTVISGSGTCTGTSSPTVINATSAPSTPTISASGSLNICQGTIVTLTSSIANGYLWSNGATTRSIAVSSAGNFSVNAYSSANCYATSAAQTVSVQAAPVRPVAAANGSTNLSSTNPSVILSSSTASAFLWNTNQTTRSITVTTEGSYTVTITGTNGCKATSSPVAVKRIGCLPPAIPTISLSGSNIIAPGQTVTLISSIGGGYLWSTGATTRSITVSTAGNYTVRIYSGGSCYSTSLAVNIVVVAPRESNSLSGNDNKNTQESLVELKAYPNPARTEMNLSFFSKENNTASLKLIDITGRDILTHNVSAVKGENQIQLNVAEYSRGVYFATLICNDQKQTIRVVIE